MKSLQVIVFTLCLGVSVVLTEFSRFISTTRADCTRASSVSVATATLGRTLGADIVSALHPFALLPASWLAGACGRPVVHLAQAAADALA